MIHARRGFSLLEVVLAAAILAGAIVVLGEAARHAMRNAEAARDLASAQLLCESRLAEIVSGVLPAESVQNVPIPTGLDPTEPAWVYSVEVEQLDVEGLTAVRVTVARDLPAEKQPLQFSLVRWMGTSSDSSSGSQQDTTADQSGSQANSSSSQSSTSTSGGSK
jgi:prepilin-type N-terminal cleavage/methylation domain-containing protein